MQSRKSLIELPGKGKAVVVTDIHGNLADFERCMKIWNYFKHSENHLILTVGNDNLFEMLWSRYPGD